VVEDHAPLREQIAGLMRSAGHRVDEASDGRLALAAALQSPPDVLVLDLGLPGLSGLALCRQLRERAPQPVPVLMLTARDALPDKLEGFAAGADDYLVKPFAAEELLARVLAHLGWQTADRVLKVHDPITGRLLWEHQRLPAAGDLIGDDDFLCVCPADGRGAVVLAMADGRIVRTLDLPASERRLLSSGRSRSMAAATSPCSSRVSMRSSAAVGCSSCHSASMAGSPALPARRRASCSSIRASPGRWRLSSSWAASNGAQAKVGSSSAAWRWCSSAGSCCSSWRNALPKK
jgi:CheY-like chemotaxis protein